jgi:hypothetical protein
MDFSGSEPKILRSRTLKKRRIGRGEERNKKRRWKWESVKEKDR